MPSESSNFEITFIRDSEVQEKLRRRAWRKGGHVVFCGSTGAGNMRMK